MHSRCALLPENRICIHPWRRSLPFIRQEKSCSNTPHTATPFALGLVSRKASAVVGRVAQPHDVARRPNSVQSSSGAAQPAAARWASEDLARREPAEGLRPLSLGDRVRARRNQGDVSGAASRQRPV